MSFVIFVVLFSSSVILWTLASVEKNSARYRVVGTIAAIALLAFVAIKAWPAAERRANGAYQSGRLAARSAAEEN